MILSTNEIRARDSRSLARCISWKFYLPPPFKLERHGWRLRFMLSQIFDSVETEIKVKNSWGQLGNLNISQSIDRYLGDKDTTNMDLETIDFDLGIFPGRIHWNKMMLTWKQKLLIVLKSFRIGDLLKLCQIMIYSSWMSHIIILGRNTKWSVEMFNKWRKSQENVPCMKEMNAEMLNYWLQRFVLEVRQQDGSEYPPRTQCFIVCW